MARRYVCVLHRGVRCPIEFQIRSLFSAAGTTSASPDKAPVIIVTSRRPCNLNQRTPKYFAKYFEGALWILWEQRSGVSELKEKRAQSLGGKVLYGCREIQEPLELPP